MDGIREMQKGSRRTQERKGYLYTIEVMIVVAIIVMSVTFIFRYPLFSDSIDEELIRKYGMDTLQYLGAQDLRYLAYNDMSELNNRIDDIIPGAVESVACIDCSAEDAGAPSDKSVIIISYYLVGEYSYQPGVLKLYLWRKSV